MTRDLQGVYERKIRGADDRSVGDRRYRRCLGQRGAGNTRSQADSGVARHARIRMNGRVLVGDFRRRRRTRLIPPLGRRAKTCEKDRIIVQRMHFRKSRKTTPCKVRSPQCFRMINFFSRGCLPDVDDLRGSFLFLVNAPKRVKSIGSLSKGALQKKLKPTPCKVRSPQCLQIINYFSRGCLPSYWID